MKKYKTVKYNYINRVINAITKAAAAVTRRIASFVKRHMIVSILSIAAVAVICAVCVFVLGKTGNAQAPEQAVSSKEMIKLIKEQEETFEEEPEMVSERSIGLIIGEGPEAKEIADGFGEYAARLIYSGAALDKYYIYSSGASVNQQIQDVRSLISRSCSAIAFYGIANENATVLYDLCSEYGIKVVGVNSSAGADLFVNSSEARYGAYTKSIIQAKQYAEKIILISDSEDSSFSRNILIEMISAEISGIDIIYQTSKSYESELDKALTDEPYILLVNGDIAVKALTDCAKRFKLPKAVITRATAGIIKAWNSLTNEGIVVAEEVKPKDAKIESVPEKRVAAEDVHIFAYIALNGKLVGGNAARAAFNYSLGKICNASEPYIVSSKTVITDETVSEYYEQAGIMDGNERITGEVDTESIDMFFEEGT